MIHPDTCLRLVDEQTGHGVFATRLIPRGTVVWLHDDLDQVLTVAQVAKLPAALQAHVDRYAYVNADGDRVLCWDHARYMNHSCDPSTTSIGTSIEIANRDIAAGEQLTCEYGLAHVVAAFVCRCGAKTCRGALMATEADEVVPRWDQEAAQAFAWALTVDQPVLAAGGRGPTAAIVDGLIHRRSIALPSWADGVPGG